MNEQIFEEASTSRRTSALFIDTLVVGGVIGLIVQVFYGGNFDAVPPIFFLFIAFGTYSIYFVTFQYRFGNTLGQWLFKLQIVDAETNSRPPLWRVFCREFLFFLVVILFSVTKNISESGSEINLVEGVIVAVPVILGIFSLASHDDPKFWDVYTTTIVIKRPNYNITPKLLSFLQNLKLEKTLRVIALSSIVLVCLVVAGYFFLYLPYQEKQRETKLDECLRLVSDNDRRLEIEKFFNPSDIPGTDYCFKRYGR